MLHCRQDTFAVNDAAYFYCSHVQYVYFAGKLLYIWWKQLWGGITQSSSLLARGKPKVELVYAVSVCTIISSDYLLLLLAAGICIKWAT